MAHVMRRAIALVRKANSEGGFYQRAIRVSDPTADCILAAFHRAGYEVKHISKVEEIT